MSQTVYRLASYSIIYLQKVFDLLPFVFGSLVDEYVKIGIFYLLSMLDEPEGELEPAGILELLGFSLYLYYSLLHFCIHLFLGNGGNLITSSWLPFKNICKNFSESVFVLISNSFSIYPFENIPERKSVSVVELFEIDDRVDARNSELSREGESELPHILEEHVSSMSPWSCFPLGSYAFFEIMEISNSTVCLQMVIIR